MSTSPHLIQAVRESRIAIGREYSGLVEELDVPHKIRQSVGKNPSLWLGGAATLGLFSTLWKSRSHPSKTASLPATGGALLLKTGAKVGQWGAVLKVAQFLYPFALPLIEQLAGTLVSRVSSQIGKHTQGKR